MSATKLTNKKKEALISRHIDSAIIHAQMYVARVKDQVAHRYYTEHNTNIEIVTWNKFLGRGRVFTEGGQLLVIPRSRLRMRLATIKTIQTVEPNDPLCTIVI